MNTTCPRFAQSHSTCPPHLRPPFYYTDKLSIIPRLSDAYLALAAPFIAYWALSLFFHFLDVSDWRWLDKCRIHESAEAKARNRVSKFEVVCAVLLQHAIQTVLGLLTLSDHEVVDHSVKMDALVRVLARVGTVALGEKRAKALLVSHGLQLVHSVYWWGIPTLQLLFAMCATSLPFDMDITKSVVEHRFVIDTWQYFLHRLMHNNAFLYKHFHSVHHRLYVPYAFGALYNHPIEGLLLDTAGAFIAQLISFMSTRQAMLLFTVSSLKTVDDHCGYRLPFDPLQVFAANNADYHDIHHQVCRTWSYFYSNRLNALQAIGIKSNFSQPFFVHWDVLLGTRMTREEADKKKRK